MPDACLPDGGVRSIPALAQWAAARYGDAEAVVDGTTRLTFRELAALARRATRAGHRTGHRARRPGRDLGAELVGVDRGRRSACSGPGPGSCRSTPASRATRRRTSSTGPAPRVLFTVSGFLDTDYVALLRAAADLRVPGTRSCVLRGAHADERDPRRLPRRRRRRRPRPTPHARIDALRARRRRRHHLHVGHHRAPKGAMLDARRRRCGRSTCGRDVVGLRDGDRYLIVNPFFHSFGYKAGMLACLMQGATIVPHAVFDVDRRDRRWWPSERISMLPGPPTLYQSHPRPPAARDIRPVVAAARGHRRGGGPGRADPPHARRARASRRSSPATASPRAPASSTMCRHDDDPETIATGSGRRSPHRGRSSTTTARGAHGGPARSSCAATTSCAATSTIPRRPPRRSTPTAGCTPATSACMRRPRLPAHHRPQEGHVHRRRLQRLPGRDREHAPAASPRSRQVAVVGVPDDRLGEVGVAFVVPRPGATLTTPTS